MKQFSLILLFVLFGCTVIKKARYNNSKNVDHNNIITLKSLKNDTLLYIQKNFIQGKSKYLNRDLSVLIGDIGIPVGTCFLSRDPSDQTVNGIYIAFQEQQQYAQITHPLTIYIPVKGQLKERNADDLIKAYHGKWTESVSKYFGTQIVKDILLF